MLEAACAVSTLEDTMTCYEEGMAAHRAGKEASDNPYDPDSSAYDQWWDGYTKAAGRDHHRSDDKARYPLKARDFDNGKRRK